MNRLEGRTALVTGGSRGIGAATAKRLAKEGAHVVVADLLDELGRRTAGEIVATGGHAVFQKMDVTKAGDWQTACETARKQFGGLDILVNNAGIVLSRTIAETSLDDWRRLQSINIEGVLLGTQACTPLLKEAGAKWPGGAAIVNLSSIAGKVGSPRFPLYSATKAAVCLFTKSTALEFGHNKLPIRVNSIHPGVIDTDMGVEVVQMVMEKYAKDDAAARAMLAAQHPMGRLGRPEEIASAIAFLCSDDASFMTGSELIVDGGYTAQ
jgi:3(or 17)beta-hydroxysteroid dehydrogenase